MLAGRRSRWWDDTSVLVLRACNNSSTARGRKARPTHWMALKMSCVSGTLLQLRAAFKLGIGSLDLPIRSSGHLTWNSSLLSSAARLDSEHHFRGAKESSSLSITRWMAHNVQSRVSSSRHLKQFHSNVKHFPQQINARKGKHTDEGSPCKMQMADCCRLQEGEERRSYGFVHLVVATVARIAPRKLRPDSCNTLKPWVSAYYQIRYIASRALVRLLSESPEFA